MNAVRFDFSGARVLVTGGTSGIGLAVASAFADAGATVTITGTRPTPGAYDVDLSRFAYRRLDVRDGDAIARLAGELDALDVLVNNAGANFARQPSEWDPAVLGLVRLNPPVDSGWRSRRGPPRAAR
jgi:NAD(P)-dependent dehydrogenase (short-subunit alcohol dehydrogenase family)